MEGSRIRLEGRLETLERAVDSLEHGLARAKALDFQALVAALALEQSPEVQEARAKVEKLAEEDSALRRLLRRLDVLHQRVEERVAKRRAKLHMHPLPLVPALEGLRDDTVIYPGHPDRRWIPFVGVAGYLAAMWAFPRLHLGFSLLFPLLILAGRIGSLHPVRVMVTRKRLVIDTSSLELSKVRSVAFLPGASAWDIKALTMQVTLVGGERRAFKVAFIPDKLVAALKAAGVEVTRP